MADETLNVSIVTNAGASAEELKNYEELLAQLAADYAKGAEGAKTFVGAQAQQAQQATQNAAAYTQDVDQTTDALGNLKDTVTDVEIHLNGLRRTGAALRMLGFEELGNVVSRAAAIQQVFRQISSLVDVIPQVGMYAGALVPILGEEAAANLAVAASIGVVLAPLVAVGIVFAKLSELIAAQKKAVDDAIQGSKDYTKAQFDLIEATQNATKADVDRKTTLDQLRLQEAQSELAYKQKFLKDIQDQYAALGGSLNPAQRAALGEAGQVAQKAIEDLQGTITDLSKSVDQDKNILLPAAVANDKKAEATKREEEATKQATRAVDAHSKSVVKAAMDLVTVTAKLAEENSKYAATIADRVQADERAGATEELQAQIDADKAAEAAQEGAAKLLAIRKSETDLEIDEAQKRAEGVQKINDQFLQNSVKLWNSYYTTEIRDEADYATQRRRKLEDLNAQLLDLAGSRDVAGFVNARRSGLTQISRGDEDETTAEQRRREDYERQAREAEQAREEQIRQLEASLTKETQTKRESLQQQEREQIASNTGKVKQSEVDAKRLSDLQAMWAKNDRDAKRLAEDNAHAQTVARLTQQQQQLSAIVGNAIAPVVTFFGQVTTAIVNMFQQVQAAVSAPASSGGGSTTPTPYASGINFVPRDMIIKAHYGERIVRAVDNHPQPQQDNRPINVSIGTWGQVVSEAQMHEQVRELVTAIRAANGAPA